MTRLRIVIDTNIVISAALKRNGLEFHLLELVAARVFILCASDAIFAEYREVLNRSKFSALDPKRDARFLELLRKEAFIISPFDRVKASPDESDNRFLECAEAAEADYLVTGNTKHFPKQWKTTKILNTRELVRVLDLS